MNIKFKIGERIKQERSARDLTQEDLARICMVSRPTISNWELGKTLPDIQSLALIAQAFDTTIDELIAADSPTLTAQLASDRRELFLCYLALASLWIPVIVCDVLEHLFGYQLLALYAVALAFALVIAFRAHTIEKRHRLLTDDEVVRYIESKMGDGSGLRSCPRIFAVSGIIGGFVLYLVGELLLTLFFGH